MELKILIACYSYSGHTLKVAEALKKIINADITHIETIKDKWYLFKLLDAIRGKKVPINPCQTDLMSYQGLILCCPVWGGKTPAAINQYLEEIINVKRKHFGVFVTSGGNRPQRAIIQMREYLDKEGMLFLGQMKILTEDVEKEKYGEIFDFFAKKFV